MNEQKSSPKKSATQTQTTSPEDFEVLAKSLPSEDLQALINRLVKRIEDDKGRGAGISKLSNAQKMIEEGATLFKDRTAGPSRDQLKKSTNEPQKIADIYGQDPLETEVYEWARKRIK